MRRLALLAALATFAACPGSGGKQQVGTQPSWRGSGAKPAPVVAMVRFAPATEAVRRYNEPYQAPPGTPLGDAVVAAVKDVAQKAGTPVPLADARLFRVCAELAEVVPDEGLVNYAFTEFALQRNGIIEPSPQLLIVWGDLSNIDDIVEQLRPAIGPFLQAGANARVGVGAVKKKDDGSGVIVFALQGSGVQTTPIPRALPANGSFTLDAVVDARYKEPQVFVTYDNGSTERLEIKPGHAGGFTTKVSCGARTGRQQVEITASDQNGSTVLANFPVWCATQPPVSVTIDPQLDNAPLTTTEDAERRLLAMVNRDRQAGGLPALIWDDKVAEVARGHSEEMRATKNVVHVSPITGSAADRVRAAKIKTAVVLENVARAYGLGEAHQGLMNSPGHRANITSRTATHIGIGVVFGENVSKEAREIFVTQVFTRVPPKIDPAKAAAIVFERISQGVGKPIGNAAKLAAIAQRLADSLAAGKTRDEAYPLVKKQVEALGSTYARVGSVITAAADLETLDGKSLLGGSVVDDIGVGVAQGPHPEIGEGAMWIVVLLGQKR